MRTTTVLAGALGAVLALTGMAGAHGPSRLKTEQTVTLDATPDEVWEQLTTDPGVDEYDNPKHVDLQ